MSVTPGDITGWLDFISQQHSAEIDLGLDRLRQVAERLGLRPFSCPSITVAGTNGKGSSITALESFYSGAGYRTACYTSPHLTVFNERIRVNGDFVDDDELCQAFSKINITRETVPLTYFEFATLAAFLIFQQCEPEIILLEVGLGGRLDATNLFPADVALITSIGIDHTAWLGNDRESIAVEKAGIIHEGSVVVISDAKPPRSLMRIAHEKAAELYTLNENYRYELLPNSWRWKADQSKPWLALPLPSLFGRQQFNNLAGVLMCIRVLQQKLPLADEIICGLMPNISLAGRFQIIAEKPQLILDVAHNPDSMQLLNNNLRAKPVSGSTHAVVAMLKDKDIVRSLSEIYQSVDNWYIANLSVDRGESTERLKDILEKLGPGSKTDTFETVVQAWRQACKAAKEEDRVVVFGSFHTVGGIIDTLS